MSQVSLSQPELPLSLRLLSLPRTRLTWKRLIFASILVLLLHLLFFFGIAPYLDLDHPSPSRTEVTEISTQDLEKLKKKIMANKWKDPLLQQELHEEYKSKERPEDAKMMAPFNQVVPKEKVAGPQPDEPLNGGGSRAREAAKRKQLDLAKLGLGTRVPKPLPPPRKEPREDSPQGAQGPPGPKGPYRPVGRDDRSLERSDQNLLNAAESEYYSFFVRFEEPIIRNWYFLLRSNDSRIHEEMARNKVPAGAELPITIEFVLDRQGNFRTIDVVESSGVPTLDWATRESVRKLASLPNPPPGLFEGGQYFTHRLRFMVHVTEAPVINSRPDLYW